MEVYRLPSDELIASMIKLARRTIPLDEVDDGDEFLVVDYVGSNVDDACDMGKRIGETFLAREVLTNMGVPWV